MASAGETIRASEILASLLLEREALQRRPEERAALEANRLGIMYWQARLSLLDGARREREERRTDYTHTSAGERLGHAVERTESESF